MKLFPKQIDRFTIAFILLKVAKTIIFIADVFLDLFFSYKITEGTKSARESAKEYANSAQIVDIWARAFYAVDINQPSNFLYRHNRYVHPDFILKHDNVIMMGITPTHAFFSVTNKTENDLRNIRKMPFLFISQCAKSDQLLILPLSSFYALANELGDPSDRHVCIIFMTGRCGSNLLCQMVYRVPNVRAYSECYAFEHSQYFYRQGMFSEEQHRQNIQSIMRLLCKPEHDTKVTHIVIKMTHLTTQNITFTKEVFPKFKMIFMTRNPRDSILSWMKGFKSLPSSSKNTNHIRDFFLDNFPIPMYEKRKNWIPLLHEMRSWLNPRKFYLFFAYFYAAPNMIFRQNKSNIDLLIVYDDLIAHPDLELRKLFKLLSLSDEFISSAEVAMNEDSQNGTFGQRGHDGIVVTDAMWKEIDHILDWCIKGLNSNVTLEHLKKLLLEKEFD